MIRYQIFWVTNPGFTARHGVALPPGHYRLVSGTSSTIAAAMNGS
jgi:hypothetical protein